MAVREEKGRAEVVDQLRRLGVGVGDVLVVHTSFRAVGPVEGGPVGLIAALRTALGTGGTLVMPSWSGEHDVPFDARRSPVSAGLGVVPHAFWRLPGVQRSNHVHAFAAVGPAAAGILADPLPLPPHRLESPIGRAYELDGKVLLLGVDHTADTTIHLAELLAGVPYRIGKYRTVLRNGRPVRVDYGENDHCCARFVLVGDWLRERGLQSEGLVGHARGRLARSRDVVAVTLEHLRATPLLFLHRPEEECEECDEARRSTVPAAP